MRTRIALTAAAALVFVALSLRGQDTIEQPQFGKLGIEFSGGLWGTPAFNIENIPLQFRQAPVNLDHYPDDYPNYPCPEGWCPDFSATTRTVNDSTLSPHVVGVDSAVTVTTGVGKTSTLRIGPHWLFPVYPTRPLKGYLYAATENTRAQNQDGTSQWGVGTSVTYYSAIAKPDFLPGLIAEFENLKKGGIRILVGFSAVSYNFDNQQGYDRFDSLQQYTETPFV